MENQDREWLTEQISAAKSNVNEARIALANSIECGDFVIAQIHCDTLKSRLGVLDNMTSRYAEKFDEKTNS